MGKEKGKELEVVKGVDLERYMGRWYEIASIPSFFQPRNGENTRATYSLNPDGTVHVVNETWSNGKKDSIEGTAYKADANSEDAKFKVKFYVPPFLPIIPVVGDYWILALDADYQHALIGEPRRRSLWVLSREQHMDEDTYQQLLRTAADQGYDVSKLHKTTQSEAPTEAPKDGGLWWIKSLFGR